MEEAELPPRWKLPRRQKKGMTYFLVALALGFLAWNSYVSGNVPLAQGLAILAFLALLLGVAD